MATKYWVSTGSSDYSLAANWSTTSGGAGGAGEPASSDIAVFDSNSTNDCDFPARTEVVAGLELRSGYTGTVDNPNPNAFIVTSNEITVASGATLSLSNSSAVLQPRAGISGAGTISGNGRLSFDIYTDSTLDIGPSTFDIEIVINTRSQVVTINLKDGTIFNSDLSVTSSNGTYTLVSDGDLQIGANFSINSSTTSWSKGTGTITLAPPAATTKTIDFNGETIEDLVIDGAGTAELTGAFTTDSLTCTAGTLDVNLQNITVVGDMTVAAGCSVIE